MALYWWLKFVCRKIRAFKDVWVVGVSGAAFIALGIAGPSGPMLQAGVLWGVAAFLMWELGPVNKWGDRSHAR